MKPKLHPSKSSKALAALLEDGGKCADAIRKAFHRTLLWKLTTGRGKPNADSSAKLEKLSDGKVPANGWGS